MTYQSPFSRFLTFALCVVAALSALLLCVVLAPAPALALPEGRVYEMVSPPYKEGYGVTIIEAAAENGESLAYFSPGTFAGAPAGLEKIAGPVYMARRGTLGWSTVSIAPPPSVSPYAGAVDVSPDLESELAGGGLGPNSQIGEHNGTQYVFASHSTDAPDIAEDWETLGTPLEVLDKKPLVTSFSYEGADDDFCHIFFRSNAQALLPEGTQQSLNELYELNRGCNGEPVTLRFVAVNNEEGGGELLSEGSLVEGGGRLISPSCPMTVGSGGYGGSAETAFNAISADGSEAFFTTCIAKDRFHFQLFVRLDAARTVEVSRSIAAGLEACGEGEIPCKGAAARPSAVFDGASEDGSRVFFTTAARLVGEDTDSSSNLYMARIGCPAGEAGCPVASRGVTSLVRASRGQGGGEADVQGVVAVEYS